MAQSGNKQKYESKNPIQRALIDHFLGQVVRLVEKVRPTRILDVGCGEGFVLDRLARAGVEAELYGLDMSASAVTEARARLGDRARIEVGDARTPPFDEPFDLVLMTEVLEHIPNPEDMLPVLDRLAREHLILSVPWEPFFMGLNFLRGKNLSRFGNDPEHVNHWGRRGFRRFVGRRFDVVDAPLAFPWTLVLARKRPAPDVPSA
ncbi:MAG: class I SAM-dependent methyltransferase [Deltaproteobacteria bacterium]|nr:MAG: class I SAM-dependent methyltransferase [Deltaproteobacteria bacterium]